jgi:hypothetical protein
VRAKAPCNVGVHCTGTRCARYEWHSRVTVQFFGMCVCAFVIVNRHVQFASTRVRSNAYYYYVSAMVVVIFLHYLLLSPSDECTTS